MNFDLDLFAKNINALRTLYREGADHAIGKSFSSGMGFLSSEKATEGSWPKFHFNAQWRVKSNHEKLLRDNWNNRIVETFGEMDKALRAIPALNHPDIRWKILFHTSKPTKRVANPLPAYRIEMIDVRLTPNFVKTPATTIKVLRQIIGDVENIPAPRPERRFSINGEVWYAATPVDLARFYAALHNPGLLNPSRPQGPQVLPAIREMLDAGALLKAIQSS